MKKYLIDCLYFSVALFCLSSCSKEDDTVPEEMKYAIVSEERAIFNNRLDQRDTLYNYQVEDQYSRILEQKGKWSFQLKQKTGQRYIVLEKMKDQAFLSIDFNDLLLQTPNDVLFCYNGTYIEGYICFELQDRTMILEQEILFLAKPGKPQFKIAKIEPTNDYPDEVAVTFAFYCPGAKSVVFCSDMGGYRERVRISPDVDSRFIPYVYLGDRNTFYIESSNDMGIETSDVLSIGISVNGE